MPTLQQNNFGCTHYKRNCLLVCNTCTRTYPCKHCHDKTETHSLKNNKIVSMVCLLCGVLQPKNKSCMKCLIPMGDYYCDVCSFWSEEIEVFHCKKCGICRLGKQDSFIHCDKCGICIENTQKSHKHISSGVKNNCPICAEYLLYSNKQVILLRCGHSIHEECHDSNLINSIHCPICFKIVGDDQTIRDKIQMMVNENINEVGKTEKMDCKISCFECGNISDKDGFLLFNECNKCGSYNTKMLND